MFPEEVIIISKLSPESRKKLRKELKKWADKNNYAFLSIMFDIMD